jgi:hypothetical protein
MGESFELILVTVFARVAAYVVFRLVHRKFGGLIDSKFNLAEWRRLRGVVVTE